MPIAIGNMLARGGQLLDQRMMRRQQMADRIGDAQVNLGSLLHRPASLGMALSSLAAGPQRYGARQTSNRRAVPS
jgi:hypothetical protein